MKVGDVVRYKRASIGVPKGTLGLIVKKYKKCIWDSSMDRMVDHDHHVVVWLTKPCFVLRSFLVLARDMENVNRNKGELKDESGRPNLAEPSGIRKDAVGWREV
jgi:hypothetical protein